MEKNYQTLISPDYQLNITNKKIPVFANATPGKLESSLIEKI